MHQPPCTRSYLLRGGLFFYNRCGFRKSSPPASLSVIVIISAVKWDLGSWFWGLNGQRAQVAAIREYISLLYRCSIYIWIWILNSHNRQWSEGYILLWLLELSSSGALSARMRFHPGSLQAAPMQLSMIMKFQTIACDTTQFGAPLGRGS